MSIASDFSIDSDNRILKHYTGSTVYTVNDLYSYLQDYFDEVSALTVPIPMTAQTPTEYTLVNGWFMTEESYKYLKTGAVRTLGWDTMEYDNGVMIAMLDAMDYVECVPSDVGLEVTDGMNTGILLDYDNMMRKWWIRKTSEMSLMDMLSIPTGTGAGTSMSVASGENLYTNVYTLGALNPLMMTMLYVEQINPELDLNRFMDYWPDGHFDIVIKVKEAGTLIDNGFIRVYAREFGDTYADFSIDLSAGGRNPVPLATTMDMSNQTLMATVDSWNDVTVTFGPITRDMFNGNGPQPYDIEIDCGIRANLNEVYERLKALTARDCVYTLNGVPGYFYRSEHFVHGANPFGEYLGGTFFGSQGVYLKNVPAGDINNLELIDSTGATQKFTLTATGTFLIGPILMSDPAAKVAMYFTSTPEGDYGTVDAIVVKDKLENNIHYDINGASSIQWSFDYDVNVQGGRTAGTDAAVTIVAGGLEESQVLVVTAVITRATGQNIQLLAPAEVNYTDI